MFRYFILLFIVSPLFFSCSKDSSSSSSDECSLSSYITKDTTLTLSYPDSRLEWYSDKANKSCKCYFEVYYTFADTTLNNDSTAPDVEYYWGATNNLYTPAPTKIKDSLGRYWWHIQNYAKSSDTTYDYGVYAIKAKVSQNTTYKVLFKAEMKWAPYSK